MVHDDLVERDTKILLDHDVGPVQDEVLVIDMVVAKRQERGQYSAVTWSPVPVH